MLFEVKQAGLNALIQGNARRAQADARAAEREADASVDEANGEIRKANGMLATARRRIAELEGKLAMAEMEASGRNAQVDAFIAQHSGSPLLADSGDRFTGDEARGQVKTRIRRIYEQAFDAKGHGFNIANPQAWRWN